MKEDNFSLFVLLSVLLETQSLLCVQGVFIFVNFFQFLSNSRVFVSGWRDGFKSLTSARNILKDDNSVYAGRSAWKARNLPRKRFHLCLLVCRGLLLFLKAST